MFQFSTCLHSEYIPFIVSHKPSLSSFSMRLSRLQNYETHTILLSAYFRLIGPIELIKSTLTSKSNDFCEIFKPTDWIFYISPLTNERISEWILITCRKFNLIFQYAISFYTSREIGRSNTTPNFSRKNLHRK